MAETPFRDLAEVCEKVASTPKKLKKISLLAAFLKRLDEDEISPAVDFLLGKGSMDVGYVTVRTAEEGRQRALDEGPLSIMMVNKIFREMAHARGKSSRKKRENLLQGLLGRCEALERKYIMRSLLGEMRIGVSEGILLEAVAEASGMEASLLRKKLMFFPDLGYLARVVLSEGRPGLSKISLQLYTPLKPMLAEMAHDITELSALGGYALEYKYDGARIQIHRGEGIKIFSRRLKEVTESLPEIVELAAKIRAPEYIVEGEVVAVDKRGKPMPFQDLMRRFGRRHGVGEMKEKLSLKLYLFDVLYLNDAVLVDEPYSKRWSILEKIAPGDILAKRIVPKDLGEAERFMEEALAEGHEGIMAKALDSPYLPGKRGKKWLKVKKSETLDVVIVGAEWGHGRRRGWLSNYHLAVRDTSKGGYAMVGKTFKGLTDEEFEEITKELLELKLSETRGTVFVKPKLVVEVAFDEIQKSPRYPYGYALRFARIKRIRRDRRAEDADTLERLSRLFKMQIRSRQET